MKKFILKLANLSLLALLLLGSFPIASAQSADDICKYASYQNATVVPESFAGLPEAEPARTEEINKRNAEYAKRQQAARDAAAVESFKDYVVVIAEEPLGAGDGKFSANCARKIECSTGNYNPAASGQQIQSCYSQYTTVSDCTPSDTVTCEIVQVYVAPVGTGLLYSYVGQIYRYVSFIGGLIAVFIIIVAGVMWTSAGGNSEAVSKAKEMITRSLVGLVVLFLSALILYTINPNFFTLG
ncbi:MAG: pilin [Candidatus Altimarinota bacterium]